MYLSYYLQHVPPHNTNAFTTFTLAIIINSNKCMNELVSKFFSLCVYVIIPLYSCTKTKDVAKICYHKSCSKVTTKKEYQIFTIKKNKRGTV